VSCLHLNRVLESERVGLRADDTVAVVRQSTLEKMSPDAQPQPANLSGSSMLPRTRFSVPDGIGYRWYPNSPTKDRAVCRWSVERCVL
jgi:hypothetical protein